MKCKPDGSVVFDHLVESVDMRHRLSGRDEVHYNSRTDPCAPHGFEDVARAVGVPLAVVTIDPQGKVLQRQQNFVKAAVAGQGEITIQLPEQAVAVGRRWSSQNNIDVPLSDGSVRRFRAMQSYTLESVKTGVATISMSTQIVTPIQDPAIEAQVLQYEILRQRAFRHRSRPDPRPPDRRRQERRRFPRRGQQHSLHRPLNGGVSAVACICRDGHCGTVVHSTQLRLWVFSRQTTSTPGWSFNSSAAAGVTSAHTICPMSIATKTACLLLAIRHTRPRR